MIEIVETMFRWMWVMFVIAGVVCCGSSVLIAVPATREVGLWSCAVWGLMSLASMAYLAIRRRRKLASTAA